MQNHHNSINTCNISHAFNILCLIDCEIYIFNLKLHVAGLCNIWFYCIVGVCVGSLFDTICRMPELIRKRYVNYGTIIWKAKMCKCETVIVISSFEFHIFQFQEMKRQMQNVLALGGIAPKHAMGGWTLYQEFCIQSYLFCFAFSMFPTYRKKMTWYKYRNDKQWN